MRLTTAQHVSRTIAVTHAARATAVFDATFPVAATASGRSFVRRRPRACSVSCNGLLRPHSYSLSLQTPALIHRAPIDRSSTSLTSGFGDTWHQLCVLDLVILIETAGESVTNVRLTANGADVSSARSQ